MAQKRRPYDDIIRHPAKDWEEALRRTFNAIRETRDKRKMLYLHLQDLSGIAQGCKSCSVPVDNAEDIYTFFVYSVVKACPDLEFDRVMAAWRKQPGRPVYLLRFKQCISPHYGILCGTTCYHLTNLPIAVTWGATHKRFYIGEHPHFLSVTLVGTTMYVDEEIQRVCEGAVASSHHYAFFNCQNYAERCLERICTQPPEIRLDWISARTTRWLLRSWHVVLLVVVVVVCLCLSYYQYK
jgi:hypothetical protein